MSQNAETGGARGPRSRRPPETEDPWKPLEYGEILIDEPPGGWEGVVPGEAI